MNKNIKTFTRSDIELALCKEFPELTKSQIKDAINVILDSIVETIALDGKVEIRGFGTFSKKNIRPRKYINPKTKKVSFIGETATMHFKTSRSVSYTHLTLPTIFRIL